MRRLYLLLSCAAFFGCAAMRNTPETIDSAGVRQGADGKWRFDLDAESNVSAADAEAARGRWVGD